MNHPFREKVLNFNSILVFVVILACSVYLAFLLKISLNSLSVIDIILLSLSCYRLSRMIVYEKVFELIRNYLGSNTDKALIGSIHNLITCPWCAGVWVSLIVFDIYYLLPFGKYLIYILAISAIATPLVMLNSNLKLRNDILKEQREELIRKRIS